MPASNGYASASSGLTPAFICGHPRGGTTLLTTLLDSHPELVVLPGESQYFQKYYSPRRFSRIVLSASNRTNIRWLKSMLVKRPFTSLSSLDFRDIRPILKQWTSYFPDAESPDETVSQIMDGTNWRGNYWDCYLQMYAAFTGTDMNSMKYWIEKTPGNEKFVPLNEAFFNSNVRYMHVLRDPRSVVSSLLTYEQQGLTRQENILRLCWSWSKSVQDGMQNRRACGERYLLVKYEDLVTATEDMMAKVQRFLGIAPDDSVLSPSRVGQEYRLNSAYSEDAAHTSGVVTTQLERYKTKLQEDEIGYIESLVGPVMQQLGYENISGVEATNSAKIGATSANFKMRFTRTELNRVRQSFERRDYSGLIAQPAR